MEAVAANNQQDVIAKFAKEEEKKREAMWDEIEKMAKVEIDLI